MKNGTFSLVKKFAIDSIAGSCVVAIFAIPAIIIKVGLKFYERMPDADPFVVQSLYTLAYIILAVDFAIAVAIVIKLAWELIKEIWR